MHDNYTTIDFNHLVKDEEMVAPLSKNIYNQKFCRNFLEKYLDENIILWGEFDRIVNKTMALMQNCEFNNNGTICVLGHMRWSNFTQNKPRGVFYNYGDRITVQGQVYQYKNTDPDFDPEFTYGIKVLQIL
ncbi:hypothetical protein [Enterocloster lavalensis]|uniref:hypothetical protein n=1 Tax=Enterocloster lavalensis TaxID=460384 RepID=UPI001D069529|nr:hypothetical protein [Enterocloster lavalensis]MCB6343666.1 hypothetical protein [Enterocloster lavalensis]